jgi:UDP-glucose 4-epimerase
VKILITGANGLLGGQAVSLLAKTHEVHALVHNPPSSPVEGVKYYVIDLAGALPVDILPASLDVLIHLAQSSRFREFPEQAKDVFNVNVSSTAQLLDYAKNSGVKKFVFASSGGVYGAGDEAFKENAVIPQHGQLGYYLGSKLCGEILAENYSRFMDVTILRFFFMYGRQQRNTMLIPRLIENIRNGNPISLQGADGIRINPIHVSDGALALQSILELSGSHILNIAGSEVLSLKQIAETIGRKFNLNPTFQQIEGSPTHLIGDIEAMKRLLHTPAVTFESGLNDWVIP